MLVKQSNLPRLFVTALVSLAFLAYFFNYSLTISLSSGKETLEEEGEEEGEGLQVYEKGDQHNDDRPRNGLAEVHTKATIVASTKNEDTSWLFENLPDWQHNVYTVNDKHAKLTVPKNKGRESQAYLTYLIDNYHRLPDYMVFLHALRYQWHNEDPMYDGVYPLQNLQLPYVEKHGYANMRCTWLLGCPIELHPAKALNEGWRKHDQDQDRIDTERVYAKAFSEIFPEIDDTPEEVGVPCGAQFAVTRWKVHERPRSDYVRIRDWLTKTSLPDNVSGRVLEYSWHVVFGMPYISCPTAKECFCEKFGKCNLTCFDEGSCEGRYQLPRYSNLPPGWPDVGAGDRGFPAMDWWKEWE